MKTSPVLPADLVRSVLALPPLACRADGSWNEAENARILAWLAAGGITSLLYGGCANLFNVAPSTFGSLLDMLERIAAEDSWIIPSIGPDYGKAMDQVAILRGRSFPSCMLLPYAPVSAAGLATGLRRLSDSLGKPLMIFQKTEDYLAPLDAASLIADGVVCTLEYGIARPDPGIDPFLADILDRTGSVDAIVDGAGERTIVARNEAFGIVGFTSGSGVVAPHLATALLQALRAGDGMRAAHLREHFLPLEGLRGTNGPIPTLHDAVALADIAETGPIGPFFAPIADPAIRDDIAAAAQALKQRSLRA